MKGLASEVVEAEDAGVRCVVWKATTLASIFASRRNRKRRTVLVRVMKSPPRDDGTSANSLVVGKRLGDELEDLLRLFGPHILAHLVEVLERDLAVLWVRLVHSGEDKVLLGEAS